MSEVKLAVAPKSVALAAVKSATIFESVIHSAMTNELKEQLSFATLTGNHVPVIAIMANSLANIVSKNPRMIKIFIAELRNMMAKAKAEGYNDPDESIDNEKLEEVIDCMSKKVYEEAFLKKGDI